MPNTTWALIANPVSGSFDARTLNQLATRLAQQGYICELYLPNSLVQLQAQVSHLLDVGDYRFIVVGGDGTLSQVVNVIAQKDALSQVKVALYPMGSGNDTAKSLAMTGRRLMGRWVDAFVNQCWQPIDLLQIESNGCVTSCVNLWGVGLDAQVLAARTSGSYLTSLLKALGRSGRVSGKLSIDDDEAVQGEWVTLMGANGRFAGGGMKFANDARNNSGYQHCFSLANTWLMGLLFWVPFLYLKGVIYHPKVSVRRCSTIDVALDAPSIWQIDGEVMPATSQIRATTLPAAIQFLSLKSAAQ